MGTALIGQVVVKGEEHWGVCPADDGVAGEAEVEGVLGRVGVFQGPGASRCSGGKELP